MFPRTLTKRWLPGSSHVLDSKFLHRRNTSGKWSVEPWTGYLARNFRHVSSSSTANAPKDNGGKDEKSSSTTILPLYQRQGDRIALLRAAWGISALNTTYWLWYSLDFIPAVNASPMEDLHIDPKIGWGALGLGVVINAVTAFYPSLLVSRMDYDSSKKQLLVYGHKLPLLSPSSIPTSYPLGHITMDPTGPELKTILADFQGDLSRFKGHLALKRSSKTFPLLLEIQNGREEIRDGETLLQALLRPKAFSAQSASNAKARGQTGKKSKRSKGRIK